jgi:hypothetical protein
MRAAPQERAPLGMLSARATDGPRLFLRCVIFATSPLYIEVGDRVGHGMDFNCIDLSVGARRSPLRVLAFVIANYALDRL